MGLEIDQIVASPVFSMAGTSGTDQCLIVGTYEPATGEDEVWLSQDAAIKDLENIGDEIYTNPSWTRAGPFMHAYHTFNPTSYKIGGTVVAFDQAWATNKIVYAAGRGYMDAWQLTGQGTAVDRIDYTDASVVRTTVDLTDPSASTWDHQYDSNGPDGGWNALAPVPQPYPSMTVWDRIYRIVDPTAIQIGPDGTVYVTYAIWDESYNPTSDIPTPNSWGTAGGIGRFTYAGILRCLDGAVQDPVDTEWNTMRDGLGPWDGLYLNRIVAGTNHAISLTFDWKEWRFKLAFWEDTLSGNGPAPASPLNGEQGVGALVSDTSVNVPISWQAQTSADVYEWQVSEDAAFTSPKSGTTSGLSVTVLDLKPATTYFWRSRVSEPMLGTWSTAQSFTTVIGGESGAAKLGTPENGGTITDTTPLFTWSAVAGATNYQIQISTDPGFGAADIVIDEELGDVQAYEADKELVNGTYYWHVKSINADNDTETPWSGLGSFTLDTEADEGAGTPVWVWVLIVLGVLLGIVVLVLILRTRRPV
jgi:hypothetical protein